MYSAIHYRERLASLEKQHSVAEASAKEQSQKRLQALQEQLKAAEEKVRAKHTASYQLASPL